MMRCFVIVLLAFTVFPTYAQTYLGGYTGHAREGKAIRVRAGTASVRFIFYKSDVLRVDFFPTEQTVLDSSFVVVQDTSEDVNVTISSTDSLLTIASSALTIVASKNPLRFAYYNGMGEPLFAEPSVGGFSTFGAARRIEFTISPDEHFYGTGERGTGLDKRGQVFDSYNQQVFGYSSPLGTMNLNVPFIVSSRGYALYFENTYPGRFDCGASNPDRFVYQASGGELSYFLFVAPEAQSLLERYTWLTGRQPLPPKWALGYIQSKYGYRSEAEARAMVETMRAKQIPCDAIVLDLYWYNHMGDLSWNASAFPNPLQMMSDFVAQGFKTVVITQPYIASYSGNYSVASALGHLTRNQSGQSYELPNWWSCNCTAGLLDMTKPGARQWWWTKHPAIFGSGVAGIWTDLGEPERHPDDMVHFLGSTAKVHNIYNFLWAKTIFDGFAQFRPDQRLFNLTRSGYAGSQRFGSIPWSGDVGRSFGGLAVQLPMMLNMGMSGFAYHNSDIGGFCCGFTSPELYVRWMQYGTFSPVARAHGSGLFVGGQDTEPWAFGPDAEQIAKRYIELRYRFLPYLYTFAYENYSTGMPIARPLFFGSPEDPNLANESSAYLLGNALLVSPVVAAGQAVKTLYLPAGQWYDFWSDAIHDGSRFVTVSAPLETLPLFVKAGSILPMQFKMNYVDERPLDSLTLAVYPATGVEARFNLYEDDGSTLAYQTGSFAQTLFVQSTSGTESGANLSLYIGAAVGSYAGKPARRTYISEIHSVFSAPTHVLKNGAAISQRFSYDELRQSGDGFFFDGATRRLFVQTPTSADSTYELLVENVRLTGIWPNRPLNGLDFRLEQNFPNPFNPKTTISFRIPAASKVTLKVFDVLGKEVATLVDARLQAGAHDIAWDASLMASGVYVYRLTAGDNVNSKLMLLLK